MVIDFSRKYKHFKRLRFIAGVLGRHGFIEVASLFQDSVPRLLSKFLPRESKKPVGVRAREALEELGPTFIKFGQILSSRRDLLPTKVTDELEKLTDNVPSFSPKTAKEILREELGDVKKIFSEFDENPFAAASLGQVHKAKLKTGEEVIVKIQRPEVRDVIDADLELLMDLAHFLENRLPESRLYQPVELVKEFGFTIRHELDYVREARNAARFKKLFEGDETIFVPKVYFQYTTSRVLVQEFVKGKKILDCEKMPFEDRKIIVERGASSLIKQVLVHGFFQADPHPGNLLVLKNNVVGVVDFGMMGFLDQESREKSIDFFIALIDKDVNKLVQYFATDGYLPEKTDLNKFREDLSDVLEQYYDVELSKMNLTLLLSDLIDLVHKYQIRMHPRFMLLLRMLLNIEGVGRRLYPDFNTIVVAKPIVADLIKQRTHPVTVVKKSLKKFTVAANALAGIPGQLSSVLNKAEEGKLSINIEHRGLEEPVTELDKTINKVSLALIVAALIISSALIFAANVGPKLYGYPLFGLAGLAISSFLGMLLVASILASRQF